MKSARRARYGAGGSLARGSLAPSTFETPPSASRLVPCPTGLPARLLKRLSIELSIFVILVTFTVLCDINIIVFDLIERLAAPAPPPPPRQSYANELLNQCRKCREEIEAQRARLAEEHAKHAAEPSSSSSWGLPTWLGGSGDKAFDDQQDAVDSSKSTLKVVKEKILPKSLTKSSQQDDQKAASTSTSYIHSVGSLFGYGKGSQSDAKLLRLRTQPTDMEHEAGWTGSGVWGLSAVGHKKRAADRDRDEKVRKGTRSTMTVVLANGKSNGKVSSLTP